MLIKKLAGLIFAAGMALSVAAGADVVIRIAPPRPVVEARVVSPGPGYVWTPGYHRWDGNAYVWTGGQWQMPPRPHQRWVAHRYVRRGGGYVLVEGHWR